MTGLKICHRQLGSLDVLCQLLGWSPEDFGAFLLGWDHRGSLLDMRSADADAVIDALVAKIRERMTSC